MSQSTTKLSRRTLFAGASTAGALATVATVLPSLNVIAPAPAVAVAPKPERGGGYSLSAHVKQYYKTTLV
jgi:hypothetical protein